VTLPLVPVIPSWPSSNRFKAGKAFRDRLKSGGVGPEMLWLPAGRFRMGDIQSDGDTDKQPVHWVSVDKLAMGRYEITVGEFRQFVNATGYISMKNEK
jgi:formylglycine-generating enzyme required for sulfatase activity